MLKRIKVVVTCNLLWLLISCASTNSKPLSVEFSSDSSKIVIKNINEASLFQLKTNLATDTSYQKIVTVLQTPTDDNAVMEVDWPGSLQVVGDSLIFTPVKQFKKGSAYLVQTMLNVQFASSEEIVKSDVGYRVKAHQKILLR